MRQTDPVNRRPAVVLALVLAAAVTVSGCADDDRPPSAAPTSVFPSPSVSPASPKAAPTVPAPRLSAWKACPEAEDFQCATLPVPLAGDDPAKGTVDLAVTRRRAVGDRIGSLVVNPGGPGASAVSYAQRAYFSLPESVTKRFDVVAFDPRGVGASSPVRCATTAELDRYYHLDPVPDDAAELAAYEQGNKALTAGCQRRSGRLLPYVSTKEAANDLDRLRAALGEDKLTYLGYSYGTSIGAQYLERYPKRVRAMVLDGAIDPTLTWDGLLEGQSRGFDTALRAFLADCERIRCAFRAAVRGDLLAAFDALAARVETTPLPTDETRTVGPGEFNLGVGAGLYSRDYGWPGLADALASAQRREGSQLLALSDGYLDRGPDGYDNVGEANLAVNCIDKPWPRETQPYLDLAQRVKRTSPRFGPFIALGGLACSQWPVPPVDKPAPVRGQGAPPVVVIGTTRDPATPYVWSQALASQLESGVLLTHDGDGHTVYRLGAPACILRPVDAYLLTGKAPAAARC